MTIQVTYGLILSIIVFISFLCLASGLGISVVISKFDIPFPWKSVMVADKTNQESGLLFLRPVSPDSSKQILTSSADIENISFIKQKNNETVIALTLKKVAAYDIIYIWLIINPDADTAGETAIYPRNPYYKGIPVDYRNGVVYKPSADTEIQIDVERLISGMLFTELRLMAYSQDGKILVDRRYNVNSKRT